MNFTFTEEEEKFRGDIRDFCLKAQHEESAEGLPESGKSLGSFSPEFYRKVIDKVTIPWVLHSDGNITEVMNLFIDLGAAAFHPIEKGAMDIAAVKKAYGDRACLLGNVDLNILGAGTPEQTDQEVAYLIRNVAPGGGYILTSGNSLASYLDPACVIAMSQAVKKYGRYPITI